MNSHLTRRRFLGQAAAAGTMGVPLFVRSSAGGQSPNEKLDIAVIGCGGRGHADLNGVKSENIVALCDVDERQAPKAFGEHPRARKYRDFRRMLDEMHKQTVALVRELGRFPRIPSVVSSE